MDSKIVSRFFTKYNSNFIDVSKIVKNQKDVKKPKENSIRSVVFTGLLYFLQSNHYIPKDWVENYFVNRENSSHIVEILDNICRYIQFQDSIDQNNWKKSQELWNSEKLDLDERTIQENLVTPAILGYIYEGSLNQKPTGSYYTPKCISNHITQETINHYCCHQLNQRFHTNYNELERDLLDEPNNISDKKDQIKFLYAEILANLRICDNSCGAGEFLLSAFECLLQIRLKCQTVLGEMKIPSIHEEARIIIEKNLYGMDLQSDAIFITRIRLWLAFLAETHVKFSLETYDDIFFPRIHLCSGNSLLMNWKNLWPEVFSNNLNPGFHIIIGNPPYGQNTISEQMRQDLKEKWNPVSLGKKSDGKTYNLSAVFVEYSYQILCHDGCLGYILNNSIARVEEFSELRRYILSQGTIWKVIDEGNPFIDSKVTLEMIDLFWQKSPVNQNKQQKEYNFLMISNRKKPKESIQISISLWREWNRWILYPDELFTWIYNHAQINCLTGTRGRDLPKLKEPSSENTIPYLFSGKTVKKYRLESSQFHYIPTNTMEKPTWKSEIENGNILITTKITDRYRVMLKPKGMAIGNNVIKLQSKGNHLDQFVLMGLLNSHLMDFIVRKYIINQSELTTAFYDSITLFTPIRNPKKLAPFRFLAQSLLFLATQKNKSQYEEIEQWMNAIVYETYFIEKLPLRTEKYYLEELFEHHLQPITFDTWFMTYWKQNELNFSEHDRTILHKQERTLFQEIEKNFTKIKTIKEITQRMDLIFQLPEIKTIEAYVRAR